MQTFRHIVAPQRIFHGPDSLDALPRELDRLGSRGAVIFCGASLARQGSGLQRIRSVLGDRYAGIYARVQAHSPLPAVMEAAVELQRVGADAVIAVGGGSAIVTARAASILLAENVGAHELCTSRDAAGALRSPMLLAPKLPQFVIPTTPTTATVKAGSAVLDPVDGKRLALFDPKTRASAVFVHPELLATASRELVASAGLNTLAMAIEGLLSRAGDPLSDGLLMHSVRLLAQHLPQSVRSDDLSMRADLMMASLICGHGTDYTGAGIAIPLGHALSARHHIDNGLANAIVLPHVLRFNADAARWGLEKIAAALGVSGASVSAEIAVLNALESIFTRMGTARRLRDIRLARADLPELARIAMDDWFVRDNPRRVHAASELQQVLESAW